MPRQEAPLEYLGKFIPQAAVPRTLQYLHEYKVHLTITRERRSVLGDFTLSIIINDKTRRVITVNRAGGLVVRGRRRRRRRW